MTEVSILHYLQTWSLRTDGAVFETPSSWMQPVLQKEQTAILKLFKPHSDERHSGDLLRWYDGYGAVHLLAADADALLLERATGRRSLVDMALAGGDDEASEILAANLERLHAPRSHRPPTSLRRLAEQFAALFEHADDSALLRHAAAVAKRLLTAPRDAVPLHGDLHHANVLDGGARGWLAIDPKALLGERGYDLANVFRNPAPHGHLVHDPQRMRRLADFHARRLDLEPQRLLDFAFAHCGLSIAWDIDDGEDPGYSIACAEILAPMASN